MICETLSKTLGFDCSPITASGDVVLISTPFRFDDGDALPVFAETAAGQIRFFDDGQSMMHFIGRGVRLENGKNTRFMRSAAKEHGAVFNELGEIEVWAPLTDAPSAFARYLNSLLALVSWERDQRGAATDETQFVEEVVMALRAWKPDALLIENPAFEGVSGRAYTLDVSFEGAGVVATGPHPNAISSVLHKLVDIHGLMANATTKFLVVIDDRIDPDAAKREALIMQSVATVTPFTALERRAFVPPWQQ